MPGQQGTSGSGVLMIAAIAFVLGRCSVAPSATETATSTPPTSRSLVAGDTVAPIQMENPRRMLAEQSSAVAPVIDEPVIDEPDAVPSVYYARCADARADGAAPIHVGEPGYASHLDRDGDGVACE